MWNPILLVATVCIGTALLAYHFYWNRVVGALLGFAFRLANWNGRRASGVWVHIGSIHFSLLAGRILLKDFRYHSSNQSIRIVKAQISWRYWLRRPAHSADIAQHYRDAEFGPPSCRVQVSCEGFEWFLYNRTAAYDSIASKLFSGPLPTPSRPVSREPTPSHMSDAQGNSLRSSPPFLRTPRSLRRAVNWLKKQAPRLDPKALLPLGISVEKGAIILGNPSTPSLLIADFQRTEGTFGIVPSRSKFDLYKQILGLTFEGVLMRLGENPDFAEPMTATGARVHENVEKSKYAGTLRLLFSPFAKVWRHLRLYSTLFPKRRALPSEKQTKPKGKGVDNDPIPVEYAIERKILEAPLLELSYYADVVGVVPPRTGLPTAQGLDPLDVGNGDFPPEWGIDLVIRSGFIRYGPWADRQRTELQRAFFPPTFQDVEPTAHLEPGDERMWTSMKIFVELRDDTTFYIPFREASKNWQWDGHDHASQRPRKRESASIHLTAGDSSSISYFIPMVASATGYESRLEVHLDDVKVTSSLNDIRLLNAESCRIRGELPSPLNWDAPRDWTFAISLRQPVVYLLRDHINMFTDLGKDWSAGPPTDWYRFVPVVYVVQFELHHYEINLYVNDHNIIDKPLVKEENAIFTLRGGSFRTDAQIPSDTFRPESTSIPFTLLVPDVTLSLSLPRWNTHSLMNNARGCTIGKARMFRLDGSYRYYSDVSEENVEQLQITIATREVAYNAVGWSLRHFMVLRDNYLGSFTHFSTLFEYLDKRKRGIPVGDPVLLKYREGQSNVLHVELELDLVDSIMMMPGGIPGYESRNYTEKPDLDDLPVGACVMLTFPGLQVHFRMHDFYMEMSVNIDTVSGCVENDCSEKLFFGGRRIHRNPKETILIDGIDITANRLFGPQPRTSTYLCIWEIHVGSIKALLSAAEGQVLLAAGNAFRFGFADSLNAPAAEYMLPVDPDITFFKFTLDSVETTWLAEAAAVQLSLPQGLRFDNNDLAAELHRKVSSVRVPQFSLQILLKDRDTWLEAADLVTDANLDIYSAPRDWKTAARAQTEFVQAQDILTGRVQHMFDAFARSDSRLSGRELHKNGLYLPLPRLSDPLASKKPSVAEHKDEPKPNVPWRWSRVSVSSASEEENGMSEADRDARLANSKSSVQRAARPSNDYEQNLSSGDESDNEDLTDPDTSDGDWSDAEPDPPSQSSLPHLEHYRRWTRHYSARSMKDLSSWAESPFVLAHDHRPPVTRKRWRTNIVKSDTGLSPPPLAIDSQEDLDITVYRIRCSKGLEVKVLPIVVLAIARLEEAMEMNVSSPEIRVDSLIAQYMSRAEKPEQTLTLDIELSSARIQLLQRVPITEEDGTVVLTDHNGHPGTPKTLNMVLEVYSTGWQVKANITQSSFGPSRTGFSFSNGDSSLALSTISSRGRHNKDVGSNDACVSKAFGLSFAGVQGYSASGRHQLSLHTVSLDMSYAGPEYMAATAMASMPTVQEFLHLQRKWSNRGLNLTQSIVLGILKHSDDKSIIDPLSTTQPSYLVQSGHPHELRTDPTFKFLIHLRVCLWHVNHSARDAMRSGYNNEVDPAELQRLVDSRLASLALDADVSKDAESSAMEFLFPSATKSDPKSHPGDEDRVPLSLASLAVDHVTVVIRDRKDMASSELSVSHSTVTARLQMPELMQHPLDPISFSQVSLRDKGPRTLHRLTVSLCLGDITLSVLPPLMSFVQRVLRVRRHYCSPEVVDASPKPSVLSPTRSDFSGTFTLSLQRVRLRAIAENLTFELGTSGVNLASSVLIRSSPNSSDQAMNHSLLFRDLSLRARSPNSKSQEMDSDILASLAFTDCKINAVLRQEPTANTIIRMAWSARGLQLSVPRSAIRLYRVVEEWRADFLPGIEAMIQELLSELEKAPARPASPRPNRPAPNKFPLVHIQGYIHLLGISLQVMHGTWLSWSVHRSILYMKSTPTTRRASQFFGLQIASQVFSIASKSGSAFASDAAFNLELPTLSLTGAYDGKKVDALASVKFFHFMVKPSHWDTLLAVQQKFGQDFNDLVVLVEETQRRRNALLTKRSSPKPSTSSLRYNGTLKMGGFKVGLEGLTSVMFLECEDIGGAINNEFGLVSHIQLTNLALSLASRAGGQHPSAFVKIDFRVGGGGDKTRGTKNRLLEINITKIHAVMQPSSIGEIGDFIDHLQADMLERKEQRALQLQAFKEKTKSVMKTFEVKEPVDKTPSWLEQYTINVVVKNVGAAFPLALDQDMELGHKGSGDFNAVRAFLLSIKSITFATQRGETGEANMENFSFQFVPSFTQSNDADFSGENHQTRNRLLYPEMRAQLRSDHSAASRQIRIGADVSGFILDIDSSIPDYVFSLVDVYRQGTERMARLSASIPRSSPAQETEPLLMAVDLETKYTAVPTSHISASLQFRSGKVRLHSGSASRLSRSRVLSGHSSHEPTDEQFLEYGAEIFRLPVVSVWVEYRATPASHKLGASGQVDPSSLMFKGTVHSSQNTLRPTLLPFLTEVVNHVEGRMRKISSRSARPPSMAIRDNPSTTSIRKQAEPPPNSASSMQISFSLRIDQSKLELTCQPDVNVIAGLHWDSGGFIVNIAPGARKVTFTGSVGGLTAGLKHGFLSEDCVSLDARNLAFSATFARLELGNGNSVSSISVVLDTEFSGGVRFSRLQDVLCFKAVWLDRIPVFNSQNAALPKSAKPVVPSISGVKQEFTTALLVRVRQIRLQVDLGQSISAVTLDLKDAIIRTKLTDSLYEVSLSVAVVAILAKGNISGHANVPDCVFKTIRRKENGTLDGHGTANMLELSLTSGALDISLESDHQKLLQYRAEPLEVEIYDDWSMITPHVHEAERPLRLAFTVSGSEIVVVGTVGTIPKLLTYANKFRSNLNAQRDGAARESSAFRITRMPKPDNPLSAVANAMINSARTRFKEAETGISYVIRQHMSLRLNLLRLVVFPRTMADMEVAQFIGRDVHARLDRVVEAHTIPSERDLNLAFSSMTISKFSQLNHILAANAPDDATRLSELLKDAPEANIVGLPSMDMRMRSEESTEGLARKLIYDFDSKFVRRDGQQDIEDIYITLNMSLYSWLTVLKKNLTREMDQALAATAPAAGAPVVPSRRKAPEPLQISRSMPSGTESAPRSAASASPPNSALVAPAMGISKSASSGPTPPASSASIALESPPLSTSPGSSKTPFPRSVPAAPDKLLSPPPAVGDAPKATGIVYQPRHRQIERLTMRQLGEATPDVMHPFFMKKAGFNLEDSLPQYVHEYASVPLEEIMEALLKLYSKQLLDSELDV
ncbi:hypothetical protein PLICRDRAFT_134291 [Plicaturopsis crispa FD-325 SS-3]|nr:hypothetical protein PLICRDRAFT_134291 [Plicaturopsis crispa FD-325 SS-3]